MRSRRLSLSASIWSVFAAVVLSSSLTVMPAHAQDPLKAAPTMYKLIFENDYVRVLEVTFKPGEKIAPHSHPNHFAYVLSAGTLSITAGEKTSVAELAVGQVMWIPAETHWATNTGKTEVRVLVTELKESKKVEAAPSKPAAN